MSPKALNSASWLTVKQMMNTNFQLLRLDDTLRTVISYYDEYRLTTLPVVDEKEKLIGVFPKKRLYQALLNGANLDDACGPYIVYNPVFVSSDLTYDEVSLVVRVTRSKVDYVVVVDHSGKVVGLIGTLEYLRESMNVIIKSSAILESLFNANYEAVVIVDNKGYILRLNPAAEGMFGLQFPNIKGRHLKEVLPEINIMQKRLLGVKHMIRSLPVIVNQIPIYEDGFYIGTVITLLDKSDVEEIVNELEVVKDMHTTLDGVLNATSDGILVSDVYGQVKYINKRASELLVKNSQNIVGKQVADVLKNEGARHALKNGLPEITECIIGNKKCIISHIPIKKAKDDHFVITGVVSTIYLDDNILTEEIATKLLSLKQQVNYYRSELEKKGGESRFEQIISNNAEFNNMKSEALRIARSTSTVLLTGESGVGKDMFARAIHASSPRSKHPFVKVNCAAIPETLLESELFGYAPGSFTGASQKGKPGYFEQAHKGSIFLDEIGDMPLSVQVKILQVLQEKQFMRVGGTSLQTVDVRIVAATNKDLREAIRKGAFREDLFYRLNVIEFHLPQLRERFEDILPLAHKFIEKYNNILGSHITGIKREACHVLESHSWPGNIRELENAIERAANYAWEGQIGVEHLPAHIFQPQAKKLEPSNYRSALSDVDKNIIIEALQKTKGNKSAAARMLNLSRSAFYEKLSKYGIS
ncbi:MAG: sigma 54-interacting transcriptional regulator [Syntrophomonas sp.]